METPSICVLIVLDFIFDQAQQMNAGIYACIQYPGFSYRIKLQPMGAAIRNNKMTALLVSAVCVAVID